LDRLLKPQILRISFFPRDSSIEPSSLVRRRRASTLGGGAHLYSTCRLPNTYMVYTYHELRVCMYACIYIYICIVLKYIPGRNNEKLNIEVLCNPTNGLFFFGSILWCSQSDDNP
jgi:hypothetical protein